MSFGRPSFAEQRTRRIAEREANLRALMVPARTLHTAVMGGTVSGVQIEKECASQSGPYMAAAKALGYCMRCGNPTSGIGGLDFCHADLGKGQGIKTDVRLGWPGCRGCHEIVGRKLARAVRRAVEILLSVMTRAAVEEAGTWPKRLAKWEAR